MCKKLYDNSATVIDKALRIFNKKFNHQIILYGPPGTSKTYSSTIIAAKLLGMETAGFDDATEFENAKEYLKNNNNFSLIQFHPSYNYEDFVRGIQIDVKDKTPVYEVEDKIFGKIANEAYANYKAAKKEKPEGTPDKYILVIDEINRAPVATVLGELIYGLEYRGHAVTIPYKLKEEKGEGKDEEGMNNGLAGNQMIVPPNLYIIGTMNTADRSIGSIDYAVRRRFAFLPLLSREDIALNTWLYNGKVEVDNENCLLCDQNGNVKWAQNASEKIPGTIELVHKMWKEINSLFKHAENPEDIRLGHTYFMYDKKQCGTTLEDAKEYLKYRLEYQIIPILKEYLSDGLFDIEVKESTIDNLIRMID